MRGTRLCARAWAWARAPARGGSREGGGDIAFEAGGQVDLGREPELVDGTDLQEAEAGVGQDAGVAGEGAGIAGGVEDAWHPALRQSLGLGEGAGAGRVEED